MVGLLLNAEQGVTEERNVRNGSKADTTLAPGIGGKEGFTGPIFTAFLSWELVECYEVAAFRSWPMGADERRSARQNVILTAVIEQTAAGSKFPVRVSNVSRYGALIVGAGLPPGETEIVFRCNGLEIAGWVAWSDAENAGLQFAEPIEVEKLTQRLKPRAAGIIKDDRQIDFRRPGFRGNQMSDEERTAVEEWLRSLEHPSKRKDP